MTESDRNSIVDTLTIDVLAEFTQQDVTEAREPMDRFTRDAIAGYVRDVLLGWGLLQPLLDDPQVETITINGADSVWVTLADGTTRPTAPIADSDTDLIDLLQQRGPLALGITRIPTGTRNVASLAAIPGCSWNYRTDPG
ncbi:hypothetical protein [Fodinicola feengrottensis]|uniref:hypothetical protein n=1 Tax=Fodinicola feengrottensis TaxID=435914 RepID=UPI00244258A5|nr:hypothetical protein [Fodinicola feengrottensis]